MKKSIEQLRDEFNNTKIMRGTWNHGVREYVNDFLDWCDDCDIKELDRETVKQTLLNGAQNWLQYSEGGCSLIYTDRILERLCSPSEIKRLERRPTIDTDILRIQARALSQAFWQIYNSL